jgi:hypothetical protein
MAERTELKTKSSPLTVYHFSCLSHAISICLILLWQFQIATLMVSSHLGPGTASQQAGHTDFALLSCAAQHGKALRGGRSKKGQPCQSWRGTARRKTQIGLDGCRDGTGGVFAQRLRETRGNG